MCVHRRKVARVLWRILPLDITAAVSASVSIISSVIAGLDTTSSVMTMLSPSGELKSAISSASFSEGFIACEDKAVCAAPPVRLLCPCCWLKCRHLGYQSRPLSSCSRLHGVERLMEVTDCKCVYIGDVFDGADIARLYVAAAVVRDGCLVLLLVMLLTILLITVVVLLPGFDGDGLLASIEGFGF